MNFSNIAIDLGAVFLAVAVLMHFSMHGKLRSFGKAAPFVFLCVAAAGAAYWYWPDILQYSQQFRSAPPAPEAKSAPPLAAMTPPIPRPAHPKVIVVEEVPAAQILVPPVVETPSVMPSPASDPYESKSKRGIKAVGRFLHLQKTQQ